MMKEIGKMIPFNFRYGSAWLSVSEKGVRAMMFAASSPFPQRG